MVTTNFTVQNNLTEDPKENVLVFLMPVGASPDFQFAAWQSLNISPNGGSQTFPYTVTIEVQAQRQDTLSTSPMVSINPGEIYDVVLSNLGGISLVKEDPATGPNAGSITPDQCAVANEMTTPALVTTLWYVNGKPCVAMPGLNQGSESIFQLERSLYFRAAAETQQGFNYSLQQVSAQTQYNIPASATEVLVSWSRASIGAADEFTFTLPSEVIPAKTSAKTASKAA